MWVGSWGEDKARRAIGGLSKAGYNRIEMPLLDSWNIDPVMTRDVLQEHGVAMTGNNFLTEDMDITSEDEATVEAGEKYLKRGVDFVSEVGGDYMCGTMYSKLGKYESAPTRQGWLNCAKAIRSVADHAGDKNVKLGLELCNRFETNLLNTARQALDIIDEIDRPNVYVHLDTYHMNIEETDMVRPVLESGDRLGYVHICESHRGYLGSGNVDFGSFFRALGQIGYSAPIVFESFSSAVATPDLSNALCIWRDLWTDSEDLANHARKYIDAQIKAVAPTTTTSA